jgi:hypothetical protein
LTLETEKAGPKTTQPVSSAPLSPMTARPSHEDTESAVEGTETLLAQIEGVLAETRAEIARAEQLIKTIRKIRDDTSLQGNVIAKVERSR